MLMNLIFSEFAIALFGMPLDFAGSITRGWTLNTLLCPVGGFIHTFFGKFHIQFLYYFAIVLLRRIFLFKCFWGFIHFHKFDQFPSYIQHTILLVRYELSVYNNGNGNCEISVYSTARLVVAFANKRNIVIIKIHSSFLGTWLCFCSAAFNWTRSICKRYVNLLVMHPITLIFHLNQLVQFSDIVVQ